MVGTIINIIAVLLGGAVGILAGARLPERIRSTIITALGLFTVLMGIRLFLKTENILIVLGSLLAGVLGKFVGDKKIRSYVVRSTDRGRTWHYVSTVA